jgi:hypothetical protein
MRLVCPGIVRIVEDHSCRCARGAPLCGRGRGVGGTCPGCFTRPSSRPLHAARQWSVTSAGGPDLSTCRASNNPRSKVVSSIINTLINSVDNYSRVITSVPRTTRSATPEDESRNASRPLSVRVETRRSGAAKRLMDFLLPARRSARPVVNASAAACVLATTALRVPTRGSHCAGDVLMRLKAGSPTSPHTARRCHPATGSTWWTPAEAWASASRCSAFSLALTLCCTSKRSHMSSMVTDTPRAPDRRVFPRIRM